VPFDPIHNSRVRTQTEEVHGAHGVVRTSTEPTQTIRNERPVTLNTQVDEGVAASPGDIPPPPVSQGGDGPTRYAWLQEQIDTLNSLLERKPEIETLATQGNAETRIEARRILNQLRQVENLVHRYEREVTYLEAHPDLIYSATSSTTNTPATPTPTWPNPASNAETPSSVGDVLGTGDVVLNNLSGDLTFRKDGNNLRIGDYIIHDAFDDSGKMVRRVYLRGGTVNNINFYGMSENNIAPQMDDHGNVTGGVNFSSRTTEARTNTPYQPFTADSASQLDREHSTDTEKVYTVGPSTFTIPREINGQVVRSIEVLEDPAHAGDILVRLKNQSHGNVLMTYRLKNAKDLVQGQQLKFKLNDVGQEFLMSSLDGYVTGGEGNDYIITKGGHIDTGNGNNWAEAVSDDAEILGGNGIDFLLGGSGHNLIDGGDGNDFIYGGVGNNNTLRGGGDDDWIVVNDARDAHNIVEGGGGLDSTNSLTASRDTERAPLRDIQARIEGLTTDLRANPTNTYLRDQLNAAQSELARAVSSVRDGALTLLTSKRQEFQSQFSGGTYTPSGSFTFETGLNHTTTIRPQGSSDPTT